MKLICTQENIDRVVTYLERVIGRQSTLPILSNFLLETEKGRLKISATNLEIGVVAYIGAKIEKEGKIAVPAKIIGNFIHNLPKSDVLEIESDGKSLLINNVSHKMKIKGLDGKDFPIIPQYKKDYFFSFPAQELKNALSRLLFCVSLNESRLELTGVHIFFYQDAIHLAATDSFRLAEEIIPFTDHAAGYDDFLKENASLILPNTTLQEIMRIITPESDEVKIALEENQVFFEIDGIQIISRAINGKYPDYKQIIPQTFTLQAVFKKEDIQRAIKIANTFSSYNANEITLSFDPESKKCVVTSVSQELGENETILDVEYLSDAGKLSMVFNPRYVLDGINALSGDRVLFLANTASTPAAIRMLDTEGHSDEKYLYIAMPIRK
jgi:DNA polymerase III subunit beta